MNELIEEILNKKSNISQNDIVDKIFILLQPSYQSIFLNYNTKKIIINKKVLPILIIREYIIKLVRKHSSYLANVKNYISKHDEIHCMIKINDNHLKKLFLCYAMFYNLDCLHSKRKNMIGIDFEFNARKIALCQVGFYPHRKYKYTFVLNPKDFDTLETNLLISTVFVQENSYKVMHGSDSLDIPYVYEELFQKNTELIFKFTKYLVDTRFLCEYFKIAIQYQDKKCSLYDALKFFNVINSAQHVELENINKVIGPIYDVKWNVHNMSSYHLKYASYDVVYLKMFVMKIFDIASKENQHVVNQLKFVTPIFRLWCYEKYNLIEIGNYAKQVTDPLNNYIIKHTTMINAFNDIIKTLEFVPIHMKFENYLNINNFKKLIMSIYKLIFYQYLSLNFEIRSSKNEKYEQHIEVINTHELHLLKLHKIVTFIEYFTESMKPVISEYFENKE